MAFTFTRPNLGVSKWLMLIFLVMYSFARILLAQFPKLEYVTPFFTIIIIAYGIVSGNIVKGFSRRHNLGFILLAFIVPSFIGSFYANDVFNSLEDWSRLTLSVTLCIAVSGFEFNSKNIYILLKWYSIGFSFLCLLSLIDYFGLKEIIGFNERLADFGDSLKLGVSITDISGPYLQRSQFSANLSICFPISLYYLAVNRKERWLWGIMCIILVGTTAITFSRMVYVSLIFTILFYIRYNVFNYKFISGIFFFFILISISLNQKVRSSISLGYTLLESRFLQVKDGHSGDTWRYDALILTFDDLKGKPFGVGFNKMWSQKMHRYANPHSLYTHFLRIGGVITLFAFLILLYQTFLSIKLRNLIPEVIPIVCCIFSMMIYAVTHLAISIIFWCFIGILFSLKSKL